MPTTVTHVVGSERMMISAELTKQGIVVRFADDIIGVIPWADLKLSSHSITVKLPDPYTLFLELKDGSVEEVPWDFARHYADASYREKAEKLARTGRAQLGRRIRALRTQVGLSQEELAKRAKIGRATLARIELGQDSPRYETLVAIARGLGCDVSRLLID